VLSGAGNTVTYTQGGGAVVASPVIAVASVDKLDLASATVRISAGFFAGDTLTAVTTGTAITASYNTATGVLTLSGSDTLANYQTVLDSVTFNSTSGNPTNFGADLSRTLTWQVNDGTRNSNAVTSKVTVVGVDQAPVLSGAGNTVTYTQGGAAVDASPAITVTHVDGTTLVSATVSISSGFFTGDVLAAVTTGTGITASYSATTGVLTLTGKTTLAHYQTVLESVAYHSTSSNPTNGGADSSRTLSWQVNDGTLNSNTVTSTVTVSSSTPAVASTALSTASIAMVRTAAPAAAPAPAATPAVAATPAIAASSVAAPSIAAAGTATPATVAPALQAKPPALANTGLSMGSLTAAAGGTVTVPVSITNARGLQSMQLVIRYDARALTPVSIERSALTSGFSYTAVIVEPGMLRIDATGKQPLRLGSGELFGLKFALAPTAAGTLRIDFASATLNDARLSVRDPSEGAIIVKTKAPQPAAPQAGVKPAINLNQAARSFELSSSKTHAWLDEFLKPGEGKNGKSNSWSVVVKPRTLH